MVRRLYEGRRALRYERADLQEVHREHREEEDPDVVLGYFCGLATLAVAAAAFGGDSKERRSAPRRWTSVETLRYDWHFEHDFEEEFTTREVASMVPNQMARLMQSNPLPEVTIDPGRYEVELTLHARFVGREDDTVEVPAKPTVE